MKFFYDVVDTLHALGYLIVLSNVFSFFILKKRVKLSTEIILDLCWVVPITCYLIFGYENFRFGVPYVYLQLILLFIWSFMLVFNILEMYSVIKKRKLKTEVDETVNNEVKDD